jgi:hypothetical protein
MCDRSHLNRQQRHAAAALRRKLRSGGVGTMVCTHIIGVRHPHGYFYFWFECADDFSPTDGIPPDTVLHGPFKTQVELEENQRSC